MLTIQLKNHFELLITKSNEKTFPDEINAYLHNWKRSLKNH